MASKDVESTDAPDNTMELPPVVIAQAEAAASNEIEADALPTSGSLGHDPSTQSDPTTKNVLTPM